MRALNIHSCSPRLDHFFRILEKEHKEKKTKMTKTAMDKTGAKKPQHAEYKHWAGFEIAQVRIVCQGVGQNLKWFSK